MVDVTFYKLCKGACLVSRLYPGGKDSELEGSTRKWNFAFLMIQRRIESCWPTPNCFIGESHQGEGTGEEVSSSSDVRPGSRASGVSHVSEESGGRESVEEIAKGSKGVGSIPKKRPGRGRGRGREKKEGEGKDRM